MCFFSPFCLVCCSAAAEWARHGATACRDYPKGPFLSGNKVRICVAGTRSGTPLQRPPGSARASDCHLRSAPAMGNKGKKCSDFGPQRSSAEREAFKHQTIEDFHGLLIGF